MVNKELGNTATCIKKFAGNDLDTSNNSIRQVNLIHNSYPSRSIALIEIYKITATLVRDLKMRFLEERETVGME